MILRIIFFLLLAQISFGQTTIEKFENYQNSHHLEKVYINHDKPFYLLGDTIWCQGVFVDGRTHQFFEASPILYVDWMTADSKLIDNYLVKIDKGLAAFQIPTNYEEDPGEYILRGYTQYQRNFEQDYLFQKNIKIFSDSLGLEEPKDVAASTDFSAKFFPEGGEIVTGLNSKVAVKVQDASGDNLQYTGVLIGNDNQEIKTFKSYNEGISFFEFIPEDGISYTIKIIINGKEKSFNLPKALDVGYTINVNSSGKESIVLNLESNKKELLGGAIVLGHVRGQLFLNQELKKESKQQLKISRAQIPSGIIHFTVLDNEGRPVCERLTFNKNPQETVEVSVDLSKSFYSQREKVELSINTQQFGEIVPASLSLSVYNMEVIPSGNNDLSIVNYLLLQSDLKGRINEVDQYFQEDNTKTNFLIDLLMLTHGWSRFIWQDILKEKLPTMEFATAEDIPIIGVVRKHKKDKPVKADVFLSILSKTDFANTNVTTDDDGIFYFKGFEFRDTTEVLIQANIHNPKKKKKLKEGEYKRAGNNNVDIEILSLDKLPYDESVTLVNDLEEGVVASDLAVEFKEIKRIDYLYHPEWSIDLDEVMIKGVRKTERESQLANLKDEMKDRGMFYFPSSQKIFLEDLPGGGAIYENIFQVIRGRVPGVQIKGSPGSQYVLIRNTANIQGGDIPATIMVDGFEVLDVSASEINIQNIKVIDVIKGLSATSVFGESGAGGVISIITRDPGEFKPNGIERKVKGSINIQSPGFFNAKEFYSPNYNKRSISHQQPNLNTTLYWQSMIRAGKESTKFSFFTGDRGGQYLIKIEGISESGYPFVHYEEFTITKE